MGWEGLPSDLLIHLCSFLVCSDHPLTLLSLTWVCSPWRRSLSSTDSLFFDLLQRSSLFSPIFPVRHPHPDHDPAEFPIRRFSSLHSDGANVFDGYWKRRFWVEMRWRRFELNSPLLLKVGGEPVCLFFDHWVPLNSKNRMNEAPVRVLWIVKSSGKVLVYRLKDGDGSLPSKLYSYEADTVGNKMIRITCRDFLNRLPKLGGFLPGRWEHYVTPNFVILTSFGRVTVFRKKDGYDHKPLLLARLSHPGMIPKVCLSDTYLFSASFESKTVLGWELKKIGHSPKPSFKIQFSDSHPENLLASQSHLLVRAWGSHNQVYLFQLDTLLSKDFADENDAITVLPGQYSFHFCPFEDSKAVLFISDECYELLAFPSLQPIGNRTKLPLAAESSFIDELLSFNRSGCSFGLMDVGPHFQGQYSTFQLHSPRGSSEICPFSDRWKIAFTVASSDLYQYWVFPFRSGRPHAFAVGISQENDDSLYPLACCEDAMAVGSPSLIRLFDMVDGSCGHPSSIDHSLSDSVPDSVVGCYQYPSSTKKKTTRILKVDVSNYVQIEKGDVQKQGTNKLYCKRTLTF